MESALKAKWVRALRSGRYKQASGKLLDDEGAMCCLGVLAKIQGCKLEKFSETDLMTTKLPRGLNAGLTKKQRSILAAHNDGSYSAALNQDLKHLSFKEIADFIEANL